MNEYGETPSKSLPPSCALQNQVLRSLPSYENGRLHMVVLERVQLFGLVDSPPLD